MRLRVDNRLYNSGGHDLLNLSFEQCAFRGGGAAADDSCTTNAAHFADGVVLRASNSLCVRFNGGVFGGQVRAMIRAYGGTFSLMGCSFHCQPIFAAGQLIVEPPDRGITAGAEEDIERGNGVDIFLALPPRERNTQVTTGVDTFGIVTAGFTAIQCDSQSYQFLNTHKRINEAGNPYNVTLTNVHHAIVLASLELIPEALRQPPSIAWIGPGLRYTRLTLNGCHFSNGGLRVFLGPGLPQPSVFSMGTRDAENQRWIFGSSSGVFDPYVRSVVRMLDDLPPSSPTSMP